MNPPTDNHNAAHEAVQESAKRSAPETVREKMVDYGIEDTPPWYLSAMLGFQHFLLMVSSNIALPLLLARPACIEDALSGYADDMAKAELIGTLQFMSGVITFLQCTFGSRLPIVQGSTVALLPPTFAILNSMGSCPTILAPTANITEFMASNPDEISVVLAGSAEHKEVWRSRVRANFLTMVSGIVSIPLLLAKPLCLEDSTSGYADDVGKAELIASLMFMSGVITFLQSTIGARLPIVQGCTAALLPPTFAILNSMGSCPSILPANANMTEYMEANPDMNYVVLAGSDEHQQIWKTRLRAVQGAIMVASVFEIFIGLSGALGFVMKYIGPLVIAPTLMMIGLPLFKLSAENAGNQWGIAVFTIILMVAFSEYMKNIKIPSCRGKEGYPIFKLFPVVFSMLAGYLLCVLFTYTNVFPNDPNNPLYLVRTDIRSKVISDAQWFRMPYPGQWGVPTVTLAGTIGMMSGLVASIVESIGDYHACARLCGAPPPPNSAVNRGIFMEGVGTLLAGAVGTGSGTTSFSTNIAAIGITKVGSRRVIQASAIIMLIFGVMTKPMAVFVTIPPAVLGAMYITLFGLIVSIGISNLQFINLNSSRNMMVLGISIMTGMALPEWIENNKDTIKTGSDVADDLIIVLLSTHMFIAGVIAFMLDNTMPGTPEERGLVGWHEQATSDNKESARKCYDMPFGNNLIYRTKWLSYLPISPSFMNHKEKSVSDEKLNDESGGEGSVVNPSFDDSI